MKKSFLLVLILLNVLALVIAPVVYGVLNNFNYDSLIVALLALPNVFIAFAQAWLANISFSGLTNLLALGGLGVGLLLGLFTLIRGFIVRRPLIGLISFIAAIALFVLGVSLVLPNAFATPGLRYFNYLLDGLSTNLMGTLFIASLLLLIYLFLFLLMIFGFTSKPKTKKPKATKKVTNVGATPLAPTQAAAVQPSTLIQPTPLSTSTSGNTQDASLNELVKLVMAEELQAMRGGYAQTPNQGYPMNMMPTSGYGIDVNVIRRVVVEELAKFQGHFISRPEAQTLIAQEIAMIKAQLKIK
jgi:hypothetical protein